MASTEEPPLAMELSPQGIAVCVLALLALLVCIPPMIWHSRNGNFPAACLIAWFLEQNFFNFVNPLIWPADDFDSYWDGKIYCDIQSKFITASGTGVAGALVCIFRSLAKALDTERSALVPSKAEKMRNLAFELFFCVFLPVVNMIIHYVVQERRYLLYGIVGCMPSYYNSWTSALVGWCWPPVILTIATIYCIIVLYRLAKYRQDFSSIVSANSGNTTKSRFVRLLILSLAMLLGSFPCQLYMLYFNLTAFRPWLPYSWEAVHGPDWGNIEKVPMYGEVFFDRWIQVTAGFLLFAFFGFGKDATMMYRSTLLKMGFGRLFPSLEHPHLFSQRQGSSSSTRFGSIGSRAKGFFRKMSSSGGTSFATTTATSNMQEHTLSMEAINSNPFPPPRSSASSEDKPLPRAPAREGPLYPHLEVWPPSPSETPQSPRGLSVSSEASTVFHGYRSNGQHRHGTNPRVSGDDIV